MQPIHGSNFLNYLYSFIDNPTIPEKINSDPKTYVMKDKGFNQASEVIDYVKIHGAEMKEIDISGIHFESHFHGELNQLMDYLPNLETFIAIDSGLVSDALYKFMKKRNLKKLEIANNSILKGFIDNVFLIATGFVGFKHLEYVGLSRNNLTDFVAIDIAESKDKKHLQELDLSGNYITIKGAKALIYSKNLPNLKTLNLRNNQIFEESQISALIAAAKERNITLLIYTEHDSKIGILNYLLNRNFSM